MTVHFEKIMHLLSKLIMTGGLWGQIFIHDKTVTDKDLTLLTHVEN
jgi:hypothetical protein